jgi:hypothetical protein
MPCECKRSVTNPKDTGKVKYCVCKKCNYCHPGGINDNHWFEPLIFYNSIHIKIQPTVQKVKPNQVINQDYIPYSN